MAGEPQTIYADSLLHVKGENGEDVNVFPITRQSNILNAPKPVNNIADAKGAPFALLKKGEVIIPD